MPSSSSTKKTEEVLEKVLPTTREGYENPSPVLCETDGNRSVKEESLGDKLKEMIESDPNDCQWQGLLSPQSEKYLRETQDMNAKLRARLTERSNPPLSSNNGQGSAFNLIGARTTETGTGLSPADDTPEQASEKMKAPWNNRCFVSEVSESNANPAITNDQDYTPDVNTPPETSSESVDQSRDPSVRRHRRSPPPPPPRRMGQSGNSSETSSQSSDPPRRSQSVRRPAPPPPRSPRQPSTPRSPTNTSFPGTSLPDPAMISSFSRLAQQMHTHASSVVSESLSKQPLGRHKPRGSEGHVTKINCADFNGSDVYGFTMNNGGNNNTGADFTRR